MSFIVPGQGQKKEEAVGTQTGAKPLVPDVIDVPSVEEPPTVEFDSWPEELETVVADDFRRTTALAAYRWKGADDALSDVVRGLDDLLDLAIEEIEATSPKPTPAADGLPFDELADLLGIPADDLDKVLKNGIPVRRSRADRRTAARAVKQLRAQLEQIETTMDHQRLTPLLGFILRITLALDLITTDEDPDPAIDPAVVALVTFALERKTAALPDTWQNHNPTAVHQALLEVLTDDTDEFTILVHSARAWSATFHQPWPPTQKLAYWQLLDDLPEAIETSSLQPLRDRLEALKV
ncbi:hypothetical protein [Kribbella sp. NPDC055071]